MADSPELVAAKRLLDLTKEQGFTFTRTAPGSDGRLAVRLSERPPMLSSRQPVGSPLTPRDEKGDPCPLNRILVISRSPLQRRHGGCSARWISTCTY